MTARWRIGHDDLSLWIIPEMGTPEMVATVRPNGAGLWWGMTLLDGRWTRTLLDGELDHYVRPILARRLGIDVPPVPPEMRDAVRG